MKWEYKTVYVDCKGFWSSKVDVHQLEDYCNQYGKEGWELVTSPTFSPNTGGETKGLVLIFKRPIA